MNAVSSVVAMILILSILTAALSAALAEIVPAVKKRYEVMTVERIRGEFFRVLSENGTFSIPLGGSSPFGSLTTSSTLRVNETGSVAIDLSCNGTDYRAAFRLFSVELWIHTEFLPDQGYVFSEGGLKIFQPGGNVTRLKPEPLRFGDGTLFVRVYHLDSDRAEVSGNGVAWMKISSRHRVEELENCSGYVEVEDAVFGNAWSAAMSEIGDSSRLQFSGNRLIVRNVNVSIEVGSFDIAIG